MAQLPQDQGVKRVVLDFDGTCTQIPLVFADYLERFRLEFVDSVAPLSESEWQEAQDAVRRNSPHAAWTLGGCPAAPAAADPYILADEAAKLALRRRGVKNPSLPHTLNAKAYAAFPAPWRQEARETFSHLIAAGVEICIVSNSSTEFIEGRLKLLFHDELEILRRVSVQSDAGKFRVCELPWDDTTNLPACARQRFAALPASSAELLLDEPARPLYLRRASYFEAIVGALSGDLESLDRTVFCGDIWEMDLAMPFALGARVHLVERAPPFSTYHFERRALEACGERGKVSTDLSGLLAWLKCSQATSN